jgi:hypothetical protein
VNIKFGLPLGPAIVVVNESSVNGSSDDGISDDRLAAALHGYSSSGDLDFGDVGDSRIAGGKSGGFSVFPDDSVFNL